MAREFGPRKNYTFLRINKDGELCETLKEEKEGAQKIVLESGQVIYQKSYRSTDYGTVTFLSIEEKDFPKGKVKYVQMSILSEDESSVDVIQLPLLNSKGGLADEVKKLIAVLPTLDYSRTLVVSSNTQKNDRGYVDKLLYFRYKADEGDKKDTPIKFSLKFGPEGNVPMFEVEENPLEPGKKVFNYKAQDAFLSKVLLAELKRFTEYKSGNVYISEYFSVREDEESVAPAVEKPKAPKATKEVAPVVDENPFSAVEEDDDSPF